MLCLPLDLFFVVGYVLVSGKTETKNPGRGSGIGLCIHMASFEIALTTWPCFEKAEKTLAKVIARCVENFMYIPENCLGLIQPLNDAEPATIRRRDNISSQQSRISSRRT